MYVCFFARPEHDVFDGILVIGPNVSMFYQDDPVGLDNLLDWMVCYPEWIQEHLCWNW